MGNVTTLAFHDYKDYPRTKWVLNRCGMAVLCIGMTYWTSQTEEALISNGYKGAVDLAVKLNNQVILYSSSYSHDYNERIDETATAAMLSTSSMNTFYLPPLSPPLYFSLPT